MIFKPYDCFLTLVCKWRNLWSSSLQICNLLTSYTHQSTKKLIILLVCLPGALWSMWEVGIRRLDLFKGEWLTATYSGIYLSLKIPSKFLSPSKHCKLLIIHLNFHVSWRFEILWIHLGLANFPPMCLVRILCA